MIKESDLPQEYIRRMKELLGSEYPAYLQTLGEKPHMGLRVNTLKLNANKLQKLLKLELREIDWISDGFYIEESMKLSKNPYYHAGLYYLQEPSAMTPAAISHVRPGDKVLDLCAAPGGKSTQLASMLGGDGVLISNDISSSRAKALLKNIELAGVGNCMITCEEPAKLAQVYEDFFDKVLVDAPCSGEGMFRRDSSVLSAYIGRGSEYFVPIQREILHQASKMVKSGGSIIYSTCTYSVKEDEEVLLDFLEKHPEFEIDPVEIEPGFTESRLLPGTARLLPHRIKGEGHFIAKLWKRSIIEMYEPGQERTMEDFLRENKDRFKNLEINPKFKAVKGKKKSRLMEIYVPKEKAPILHPSFVDFLLHIRREFDRDRFFVQNEYIYYLPAGIRPHPGLHYLRTGLLMGRISFERFEPSQALAMHLKKSDWKNPIDLKLSDERVLKYLKGETIDILETETEYMKEDSAFDVYEQRPEDFLQPVHKRGEVVKRKKQGDGYRLLCVDSFPLGFVKQSGLRLKNKLYAGWRMV